MTQDPTPQSDASNVTGTGRGPGFAPWIRKLVLLETVPLTLAFWLAVLLSALAFGLCPYPPMIDYPQHVASGAVFHRMLDSSAPEWNLYETNLFTYNAGIETAIAFLSFLMRPELAGRFLFFLYPFVFALAVISLCNLCERPRWYALLSLPLVHNFTCGWGFANFVLITPIVWLTFVGWIRIVDGRRNLPLFLGVGIASMAIAYTHVLAMLCLCAGVAVISIGRLSFQPGESAVHRIRSLVHPALVLVPAVAYSLGARWWAHVTSHTFWEHAWADGQDEPAWQKLRYLFFNASGNFADGSDQYLLMAAMAVAISIVIWAPDGLFDTRLKRVAAIFFAFYIIVPKVMLGTFHIYIRLLPYVAVFALASLPAIRPPPRWLTGFAAFIALASGGNLLARFLTIPEIDDAMAIIDDIPEGHKLLGVTYDPIPKGSNREIWVHLPAAYQARKRGIIAYTFARNESPPVRYQADREPPRPPGGFEWNGNVYDPHQPYARFFDLVLVRAWLNPDGSVPDPAPYVFKDLVSRVRPMSRRGRFFLYDVSGLADAVPRPAVVW